MQTQYTHTAPCFLLLFCAGMCSSMGCNPLRGVPAVAWIIHAHSPSEVSLLQHRSPTTAVLSETFVLTAWSCLFQECVSSCVPNTVLFHISSASSPIFSKTASLHGSSLVSFFVCLPMSPFTYLFLVSSHFFCFMSPCVSTYLLG